MAHIKILDGRSHVWQWDTSIAIKLVGSDADELHFANEGSETAYFRVLADGECNIPNICLQTPGQLRVYAFKDGRYTDDSFRIQIVAREKPADYIEPEREAELVDALEDRLSVNERFIGNTADRVSENDDFVDSVETALKRDNDFIEKTRGYSFSNGRGPGKRLNDIYPQPRYLANAIKNGDFSQINVGDYYETTFNGTFSKYGTYIAEPGTVIYNDPDLTDVYGTLDERRTVTPDATQNKSAKLVRTTSQTTNAWYCSWDDCTKETVTLGGDEPITYRCYVGAINPYRFYGDMGLTGAVWNHVLFYVPEINLRDRMLRDASSWETMTTVTETVDSPTDWFIPLANTVVAVYTVRLNGVTLTENTDYTVTVFTDPQHHQWTRVNLQTAAGAVAGDTITIDYALDGTAWNHTAIYRTLNASDGLVSCFADSSFASYIKFMRLYAPKITDAGAQWIERGKLFLPTESEMFGATIHGNDGGDCFMRQLECFFGSTVMTRMFFPYPDISSRSALWTCSFASKELACHYSGDGRPIKSRTDGYNDVTQSYTSGHSVVPYFVWGDTPGGA